MSKGVKGFLLGALLISVCLVPACRPKKPKVTPPQPATVADTATTTPDVAIKPNDDFVKTDTTETRIDVDKLPGDLDEANRMAQQRGLIRDAFFDYDGSTLSTDAQDALTTSATWLKRNPQYNLLIEGHCDERGTEQYNLALGDRRANTAKEYLVTLGVDAGRVRIVSYGEERPFEEEHNESAWAKNRRAHLVLTGR
jgi:peptidoglycan-associated lipoprotein